MTNCKRYLELPLMGGKSKVNTFREIQERVTKRVMGWKEKHIAKAEREVLIKTVAQAIPNYSMSMFKFPNSSFMEAELGSNPSFLWRSLLEARELIRAGTTWKVGDGQSIRVTDHRWLTHPPQVQT